MGLDMYLERFPRYKGYTPQEINALEDFLEMKEKPKVKDESTGKAYTFEEWTGKPLSLVPEGKDRAYLKQLYKTRFHAWDDKHKYPHKSIHEGVGYWRKANAIHNWFVNRVQDGEDDCNYHNEVTEKDLEDLLDICENILDSTILVNGKVVNGYRMDDNANMVPVMQDGRVIKNPELCKELLPCTEGFFFGSTEYDQWYLDDIRKTEQIISRVLRETDFEKQMIYYISSW
jgi:hypothetical protein